MTLDSQYFKRLLLSRREELLSIQETAREGTKPVELDQQSVGRLSRMDAMQVQAMALASEERRRQELHRIEEALKRVDEGEYGYCAGCGEEIALKRLELNPTVQSCIACAKGQG